MKNSDNSILELSKNSHKSISSFTKKYSLNKTLRFELKPTPQTRKFLGKFVKSDQKRDKDYKELKSIIDEYHKYYIDKSLSKENILDVKILDQLVGCLFQKEKPKEIEKLQQDLRKQVVSCFQDNKNLFEKTLITKILPNWLSNQEINNKDHKKEIVRRFRRFTTYLSEFNKNRKNMYSDKDQSTAISHRIVNENFTKFILNRKNYKKISTKYPELNNELQALKEDLKEEFNYFKLNSIDDLFEIALFNQCLSQSGIDQYNTIIRGKPLDENKKIKGVNEVINLYRQKKLKDIKSKNLPKLKLLFKQILSDKNNQSFLYEDFENGEDLIEAVKGYWKIINNESILIELVELFKDLDTTDEFDLESIYYSRLKLGDLSNKIFEDYSYIKSALENYSEKKFKTKKDKDIFLKEDFYSIKNIEDALKLYHQSLDSLEFKDWNVLKYFRNKVSDAKFISDIEDSFKKFVDATSDFKNGKEFTNIQIESIKDFLDKIKKILWLVQPFYLQKGGKKLMHLPMDSMFYGVFDELYKELFLINRLYDKSRNYITSNKRYLKKFKINFEDSTLLNGWDLNKETMNLSIILRKKNKRNQWDYYLGVMDKRHNKIFDYGIKDDDSEKTRFKKNELKKQIISKGETKYYEKMVYKQIADALKDIHNLIKIKGTDEVVRRTKFLDAIKKENIPDIYDIRSRNSYLKNSNNFKSEDLIKFIDYYKFCAKKYWKWANFKFKDSNKYEDFMEFTNHIRSQGYQLSFDTIKTSYIEDKIKNGELYLFQIYNKDFSKYSKGSPNLHTSYFKLLFTEENLKNIVYKLNGEAKIFHRKKSKERKTTHPKNQSIGNKNPDNQKKSSVFNYDLIKDKRFTEDKFFLHLPITLNFKCKNTNNGFNKSVLNFLNGNNKANIIGIDRGEKHLAYYTIINQYRQILKQGSFNQIRNTYQNKENKEITVKKDFHKLLTSKEVERDEARKKWKKIENIKELKSGYISHLVHQISRLIIENNAIVVFEDLNSGFKRSRMKFEKQIYQKLEKALIDKLNYLVFKDINNHQIPGGMLNAYQLTAPVTAFKKMGKQTGFLFYVPAYYTSTVCPLTGFVNIIYPKYQNIEKSQSFFKKFEDIFFNKANNYFVFKYQDSKVNPNKKSESQSLWEVCTHGQDRFYWNTKNKKMEKINITQELKKLFDKHRIEYKDGSSLLGEISSKKDKEFFKKLISYLKIVLDLRYFDKEVAQENKDFILSPVKSKDGRFFDSREVNNDDLPKDSDANGAYHIALKGLFMIQKMKKDKNDQLSIPRISNKDWFSFIREKQRYKKAI